MGVPKKKTSYSRKKNRQAHQKLKPPTITFCPQCNSPKLPHFACPACGYYKGEVVAKAGKKEK
ncbi:50S ribosomal protein L32 [Candidatus Aerophobetes bacterium]|uniref:Large ribosomal subunit protein bL32 n=1 Tax=Aerophobetes bacterium TaxID=2030807 RepID=A0A7V5HYH7_UNCAE|nr:50S ribosomal protein L32 [Candidatus Aerophobetes bacterium]HHF98273.1 50S ribosomal protein L32 [Candidatus Aerophobetes bacterium]